MILIADSGSTKTDWYIVKDRSGNFDHLTTGGINPFFQSEEQIILLLEKEFNSGIKVFDSIFFYGAGCTGPAKKAQVEKALDRFFMADNIYVYSDLLAAARSLCGDQPGIAVILGTGSNSCSFDGIRIIKQVKPLGYILGDEGSGSAIGRLLLSGILRRQLPEGICNRFYEKYKLGPGEILDKVYSDPFPNRFIAGFTRFISENIDQGSIQEIVKTCFNEFFDKVVSLYAEAAGIPLYATGSVSWHFREILRESAKDNGYAIEKISRSPGNGLIKFHCSNPR